MCLPENSLQTFLEITFFCYNEQKWVFWHVWNHQILECLSDLYSDYLYALSEINMKALVGEAMNAVFKGK